MDYIGSFELIFTVTYSTVLVDDRPHEPNTHTGKRNFLLGTAEHMPTLLTWIYSGGSEGSEEAARRGEQLAYPGDAVVSDELGAGKVVRLDGGTLVRTRGVSHINHILTAGKTGVRHGMLTAGKRGVRHGEQLKKQVLTKGMLTVR